MYTDYSNNEQPTKNRKSKRLYYNIHTYQPEKIHDKKGIPLLQRIVILQK